MRQTGLIIILFVAIFACGACSSIDYSDQALPIKAIYLAPLEGGQLSNEDLAKYPEVAVVHDSDVMKNLATNRLAIWIDKDAVDFVDQGWFSKEPQNTYPLVLIGYNDALYSFKKKIHTFLKGPRWVGDESQLEPGFSVWMLRQDTPPLTISAFMQGYKKTPTVGEILAITNGLLEGNFPSNGVD